MFTAIPYQFLKQPVFPNCHQIPSVGVETDEDCSDLLRSNPGFRTSVNTSPQDEMPMTWGLSFHL
jgi:hypothetical protein